MTASSVDDIPHGSALPNEAASVIAGERDEGAVVKQYPGFAIAAFIVAVAILVGAFQFPPLLDYPNHYARMWLLAGGISTPPFASIYAVEWNQTFTNVGIDLMAYWLGPVIGIPLLARILLFSAIVLPPLGAIVLHRRLFGGAYYWQIAMLFLAWCSTLIGGFINFQIGLGMALLFAAVDHALQPKSWWMVFLWRLLASLLLTIMHIFSLGFYLAIVFGLEFSPTFAGVTSPGRFTRLCGRLAIAGIACLLLPVCLFLMTPVLPGGQGGLALSWNNSITLIFANLLSAVWTYSALIDVLMIIPIVLVCTNAIRTRRLQRHAGLLVTAAGLLIIACISPRNMMGTGWISWRFPIMAALVGMVMICPLPRLRRRQAMILAIVLTSVVFARTAWIGFNWWQAQGDVSDVRAVLAAAPEGAAILPLANKPPQKDIGISHRYYAWAEDTFRHLPTLAVPFAHDFIPTIFTAKGKQPLTVLPPWSEIAVSEGNLFTPAVLNCPAALESYSSFTPYLRQWRQRFDLVLILNADMPDRYIGDAAPPGLKLVRAAGFAKLYAIDKSFTAADPASQPANCPSPLFQDK